MHSNTSSFSIRSVGSIAIAALLISGVVAFLPLMNAANAQGANTITTSADSHGNKFFGDAILEVLFTNPQHASDSGLNTIQATVTAFGGSSTTYSLTETSTTSGIYQMYVKVDNTALGAASPQAPKNPFSTAGANTCLFIGPSGVSTPYTCGTAKVEYITSSIVEGGTITLSFGGVTKTVTYDDSSASLKVDRSVYGPFSKIYAQVEDQDFNLDPTDANTFVEPAFGTLVNGTDQGGAPLPYTETGANSGKLEAIMTATDVTAGDTVGRSLTASDYKNIAGTGTSAVTLGAGSSVGTSSASYTVKRVQGAIQPVGTVSYASELPLVIKDSDRNIDSRVQDSANGDLIVTVGSGTPVRFDLREQSANTENIVPSYGNDKLKLSFHEATNTATGVIGARPGQTVDLKYEDATPNSNTSSTSFKLTQLSPTLTADSTKVGPNSDVTLTLDDADLNDDSSVIESYTVQFAASTTTVHANSVMTTPSAIVPFSLEIKKGSSAPTTIGALAVTFTETGANTGKFEATVNVNDIATGTNIGTFSSGNTLKFEVKALLDNTISSPPTSSVSIQISIGTPDMKLDKSTTGVPRPTAPDQLTIGGVTTTGISNLGDQVVGVTINDAAANSNSLTEETLLPAVAITGSAIAGTDNWNYTSANGKFRITITPAAGATFGAAPGVTVSDAIKETGISTGAFTGTITFSAAGASDKPAWIGAKAKIEYAGIDNTFDNSDDASDQTVTFTARSAVLTTDTTLITTGGKLTVTVRDADANLDSDKAETVKVEFNWEDSKTSGCCDEFLNLDETTKDSGVFTATVNVGTDTIDSNAFRVKADTDVTLTYFDLTPSINSKSAWLSVTDTNVQLEKTLNAGSNAGALSIGGATKIGPSTKLQIVVVDYDLNIDPADTDNTGNKITVVSDRGASVQMNLKESEDNSGRFVGDLKLIPSTATATLKAVDDVATSAGGTDSEEMHVLPGDVISARYQDDKGANGQKTTISKTVEVTSVDPEIKMDNTQYGPNDQVKISVVDIDADTDPDSNDIKNVKVTSSTDQVGLPTVQLVETGSNTGVFEGTVQLSSVFATGALQVTPGDSVTVRYTDTYPADYKTRLDGGGTTTKDFLATVKIGGATTKIGDTHSTTPSAPTLKDISGKTVTDVAAGSQVLLSTTIKNNEASARTFVAIIEVRDSSGQTLSLQFQEGTLNGNEQTTMGGSWTPSDAGSYKVRTLVLSELGPSAIILSPTAEATVTVS